MLDNTSWGKQHRDDEENANVAYYLNSKNSSQVLQHIPPLFPQALSVRRGKVNILESETKQTKREENEGCGFE